MRKVNYIERNTISCPYVILCEGRDCEGFLITYLNSEALKKCDDRFSTSIQVFDFKGISNLGSFMKEFKNREGYNKVRKILVIRDAEDDYEKASASIKRALENNGIKSPENVYQWNKGEIDVGFLLLPTCDDKPINGTLEDLCVKLLKDDYRDEVLKCEEAFFNELKSNNYRKLRHVFKSKLHTYFSVTEDYISAKVGEAAKWGAFDWESKELDSLKEFIAMGFE